MNKPVGGRGKKAPYETQVIRVPEPIVNQVEQLIENYRTAVVNNEEIEIEQKSNFHTNITLVDYDSALQKAKEIVKQKRSAAESIAKLLQVLYGGTVSKENLK